MDAIKTIKLTKYYGKMKGIENLDLTVKQGEIFGFIGPNGAGKSTTIRTLLGLIAPTRGQGQILGMDIGKERKRILQKVGYLPSESAFYPGMKVKDVLRLSADLRKKDCQKEAEALCDRLQLDMQRKVEELSFGNRKKTAIVCALQHKPELLILDEPTGGLDPLMQKAFFEILKERNKDGATVFLSSHILSEIQRNCMRAAIIREGEIVVCDSVDALAKTNAKRITIQGEADLDVLVGIRDRRDTGEGSSFLYNGDIRSLLQVLSAGQISDISIAEPDLEEIFFHYYAKDGENI